MWVTADLIAVDQTVGTSVRMQIRRRNWASDDFDFIHQFETYFVDLTQFFAQSYAPAMDEGRRRRVDIVVIGLIYAREMDR